MSTVAAAILKNSVVIGSDTLLTQGETKLSSIYSDNNKIFIVSKSCIGLTGSASHYMPLVLGLRELGERCDLWGAEAIFKTFTLLHKKLKDDFFLNPKKQPDDAYEANHISAMVANGSGIFGVYAHREVLTFNTYWANGSGRSYALGAMHSIWQAKNQSKVFAETVVKRGLAAATEFDRASADPVILYKFDLGVNSEPCLLK